MRELFVAKRALYVTKDEQSLKDANFMRVAARWPYWGATGDIE